MTAPLPRDLRVNQLHCEVTPLKTRHVIVATAVIYFLLTAALVILP